MKKQLLSIILALLPMLAMADASGSCGTNVTWTYNSTTKTLTIQGSGMMTNYNYTGSDIPWYSYKNDIKTVIIEDGVTSIGRDAFWSCSSLTSITIPNSVVSIGYDAFYGCSGLQKVIVPDIAAWCGIMFFPGSNPLYYAHHIYSDENTEIKDLVIPNTVTSIESYAFMGCSGLTSVTIPNSVTSIEEAAFFGCSGLTSVIIPNSVTSIGGMAFWGCSGLTSVTMPNSVTSIGYHAFYGCSGLTSITIPNSVTSIEGYVFCGCSGLTSVTIGNSVTSIGERAFGGCSGLTSVTIPNSVTSIGISAFEGCSGLTSVTIGSGIMKIDYYAFSCSPKLSTINVLMDIPVEINEEAFKYTGENYSSDIIYLASTLNVPIGRKNVYSNVKGWSKFANIQETEFTGVETIKQKSTPTSYYSVSGEKLNNVHHGINIIRMSDGTTRKVVVK